MSERDDDGQALTAVLSDTGPAFPGTLRDWFAGQALGGSCADPNVDEGTSAPGLADWCYQLADAMLAERAKMERGQAPDPPAAVVLDTVAAQPAPASCGFEAFGEPCNLPRGHEGAHDVPASCLNCGLILDSARDYCLVCGCKAWLFSQRESDIKCTLRAGHDGDHLNGAVSWGGSS